MTKMSASQDRDETKTLTVFVETRPRQDVKWYGAFLVKTLWHCDLDLSPFDIKTGLQVTRDFGNL